jgi:hypothetical protein
VPTPTRSFDVIALLVRHEVEFIDVDALEQDNIERSRTAAPELKLAQALELMPAGIRLQRSKLQRQHPDATPAELERGQDLEAKLQSLLGVVD